MAQKKAIVGTLSFILVAFLAVGYFALAGELGGKDDPLVTIGYLDALVPELEKKVDAMISEEVKAQSAKIQSDFAAAKKELQDMINQFGGTGNLAEDADFVNRVADAVVAKMGTSGGTVGAAPETFAKVVVPANKTVTVSMGGMLFIRLGSATCHSTGSPGLIDLSSGGDLANGGALVQNHLYTVTVDSGRGFKTGGAEATVFILGKYNIE